MSEPTAISAPASNGPTGAQLQRVQHACALIDAAEGAPPTLAELAGRLALSPGHLQRLFRRATGVSPRDYADARRDSRLRAALRDGEGVTAAIYAAGFGSPSRVYEDAHGRLGMTPAAYAKGGAGAHIAYGLVESPLGCLLVAATAKGLCFIALGEGAAEVEAALRREFPRADSLHRDDAAVAPGTAAVLAILAGETPALALPLDIRMTAFQRRVWQSLIAIPPGKTQSYSDLAEGLGLPGGQRAVARACATNPVALVLPCHRVLRGDGGLGGYRWGVERKKALLARERAAASAAASTASPP
jgi:AraC family transcriptional regulator of adaptative response/methylated-DNA-[protein]-cysteine methyltransferase